MITQIPYRDAGLPAGAGSGADADVVVAGREGGMELPLQFNQALLSKLDLSTATLIEPDPETPAGELSAEEAAKKADILLAEQRQGGKGEPTEAEKAAANALVQQDKVALDEINKIPEDKLSDQEKAKKAELKAKLKPADAGVGGTDTTVIQDLRQSYESQGYRFTEQYEDTVDGLNAMNAQVANQLANSLLSQTFSQFPEVQELLQHRQAGFSVDSFRMRAVEPEFKKVTLGNPSQATDDDAKGSLMNQYKSVIRMELQNKGVGSGDIDSLLGSIEDLGLDAAYGRAKSAMTTMEAQHETTVKQVLLQEQQKQLQQQAQIQAEMQETVNAIRSNDFNGIKLPMQELQPFANALSAKDALGHTPLDRAYSKLTVPQQLLLDYIVFKGFDPKFFGAGTAAQGTRSLSELKKKNEQTRAATPAVGAGSSAGGGQGNITDLRAILGGAGGGHNGIFQNAQTL